MWGIRFWACILFGVIALGNGVAGLSRYRASTEFSRSGEHTFGVVESSDDFSVVVALRDTPDPRTVIVRREGPTLCDHSRDGKYVNDCLPAVVNPGFYLRIVISDEDPELVRAADAVDGSDPVAPSVSTAVGLVAVGVPAGLALRRRPSPGPRGLGAA